MDIGSADHISEKELILGCVNKDPVFQQLLYRKYSSRMLSVLFRYVGNKDDAQDLLQEGFVMLFDKIKGYNGTGSFDGWIRKLFVNSALMHLRKRDILRYSEEVAIVDREVVNESWSLEHIAAEDLLRVIASMPPGFRTIFNLYAIEGYSHQEIGKILNISESSSRSQLSRARIWLKERIKY